MPPRFSPAISKAPPKAKPQKRISLDRGLDAEAIARFGLGFAPSGGDVLWRHLKSKYPEKLAESSGLVGRDPSGRVYDRFRRRIMFPIANDAGKIIAFGGRALGDDLPKYLNSPETPIYTKSRVLYHLDRAKEAMRQGDAVVLVEGYMDTIAVARAGITNVVASCGTSLTETQVKLLTRFTRRVIVNYDPDTAGQAATERSLAILLEQNCDVRVLALPGGKDPDSFIRDEGAPAYRKLLEAAPPYLDYLIGRARRLGIATAEEKLRAVNFLMPFVQRIPDGLLRSEWASRISQQLRVDEPVLREALRRAVKERRSEVKTNPSLVGPSAKKAERRLVQMLLESDEFRARLVEEISASHLHEGLETQKLFVVLLEACAGGEKPDLNPLAESLEEKDRRLLFEIAFGGTLETTWEEAEDCLRVLRVAQLRPQLRALQEQGVVGLPHDKVLTLQAQIRDLQTTIARLEGKFEQTLNEVRPRGVVCTIFALSSRPPPRRHPEVARRGERPKDLLFAAPSSLAPKARMTAVLQYLDHESFVAHCGLGHLSGNATNLKAGTQSSR